MKYEKLISQIVKGRGVTKSSSLKCVISKCVIGLSLGACSQEDLPRDYWRMSPPTLVYSESDLEGTQEISKTKSIIVSDEVKTKGWVSQGLVSNNSNQLTKNPLSYDTRLEFKDLDPHVKFNVLTHCKYISSNEESFKNLEEEPEVGDSSGDSSEDLKQVNKNLKVPKIRFFEEDSKKLEKIKKSKGFSKFTKNITARTHFLYNYLPDEVIFDSFYGYEGLFINYECSFKITAQNKIGSTHEFQLRGLLFNTSQANELNLETHLNEESSRSSDSSDQEAKTIQSYSKDNKYPFLTYEEDKFTYKISHYSSINFLAPTQLRCLGDQNSFNFPDYEGRIAAVNFSLRSALQADLGFVSIAFLKKCRVISRINSTDMGGQKVIWSDYFNIVFDRPQIEISQTFEKHDPREVYPKNQGTYRDSRYGAFYMRFTNKSKKRPVRIHLPEIAPWSTKFGVLARDMQNPTKNTLKVGSRESMERFKKYVQVQEEFFGNIWFTDQNLEPIYKFELDPEKSLDIYLAIEKPFSCTFLKRGPLGEFYQGGIESGFRISALDMRRGEDLVDVFYINQGNNFERFPDTYFLHELLPNRPNHIKKNLKTPFAIDTYVVRPRLREIKKHDVRICEDPWRFLGGVNEYSLKSYNYKWSPDNLVAVGKKGLAYPISDFGKSFCTSLD